MWLVIEDTSPQYIGCYGNSAVNTPNIDGLASTGVRFSNAYSTGTVSSPSRSTIITGVKTYKTGTGNHRSNFPIPDFIKGFPYYLKQAGYYTSNNSKTDYNTSDAKRIITDSWNESSATAGWWNRKPGQPFFSIFNFGDSHQSRTMTNPYHMYEKQVLDLLPDSLEVSDNDFQMPPFYKDTPEMRKQLARVYNGVSLADYKIGQILSRIEKEGLMDSTIIFFYADHGEGMPRGKSNGIGQGYKVPFVVWFPEIYRHLSPWGTEGVVTDEHIDFSDLAPTILSLAGVDIPEYFDGRAFLGSQREEAKKYLFVSNDGCENSFNLDRTVIKNNLLYTRHFTPYSPQLRWIHYFIYGEISRLIINDYNNGKLSDQEAIVMEPREGEYLYDLSADPWEMHDLSNDRAYREELDQMRRALEKNIVDSKDVLFNTEYELKKLGDRITPYEYRLLDDYDFNSIWEAAKYAGLRDAKSKNEQIRLLNSPAKVTRLWAAIGLKSQSSFDETEITQISHHLFDPYPPVQIFLASTLYDMNKNREAREVLEKYLSGSDPDLVLMVLHNLHYMQRKGDFIEQLVQLEEKMGTESRNMELPKQSLQVLLYRLIDQPLEMEFFW
ncbi:sulfatase [uncultured Proteiniphilum sp.]|uniref:sulfatase family protein n=1 Tax=uncultured Proteiniphilum sp. TaxID=497637 RepID=UPI002620061D|nr:sulfatase [uncultured Proteiniphilum sp.]